MALEYNWTDAKPDEQDKLLPYKDWEAIEPALTCLNSKTGIFIDPYSDTRLSDSHAVLLHQLITQDIDKPPSHISELCGVLAESGKTGRWLLFVGD